MENLVVVDLRSTYVPPDTETRRGGLDAHRLPQVHYIAGKRLRGISLIYIYICILIFI